MIREGKGSNKSDTRYTSRVNVITGRIEHAPESKLVPTFAGGRGEGEAEGWGGGSGKCVDIVHRLSCHLLRVMCLYKSISQIRAESSMMRVSLWLRPLGH